MDDAIKRDEAVKGGGYLRVIQLFVPLNHLKTSFATYSRPLRGLAVAVAKSLSRVLYKIKGIV